MIIVMVLGDVGHYIGTHSIMVGFRVTCKAKYNFEHMVEIKVLDFFV